MKSIAILGRLPDLSIAELEALYGARSISAVTKRFAVLDIDPQDIEFDRLGGCIKLARVWHVVPSAEWQRIDSYLQQHLPAVVDKLPDGKVTFGISLYGVNAPLKHIERTALSLKKLLKRSGRPVRVVLGKSAALSTAQVLHNGLTDEHGIEIVCLEHLGQTLICQTVREQDIDAYAARDQARPNRDARVGMLPPKLAQTIINLACGQMVNMEYRRLNMVKISNDVQQSHGSSLVQESADEVISREKNRVASSARKQDSSAMTVLDPFCGTGVVLQEALLMGFDAYGTDLDQRMVQYSIDNMFWLRERWSRASGRVRIEVGDATTHTWQAPVDIVACETYLGEPLAVLPPRNALEHIVHEVNALHVQTLKNLARQLATGTHLCLAIPAWRERGAFRTLPLLDSLEKLGYNRIDFEHVETSRLFYYREDQIVARQLLILTKR